MVNHLYWPASSTPRGMKQKLEGSDVTVQSHPHNIHKVQSFAFPKCQHPCLRGNAKRKKWIEPCKFACCGMNSLKNLYILCVYTQKTEIDY